MLPSSIQREVRKDHASDAEDRKGGMIIVDVRCKMTIGKGGSRRRVM